MANTSAQLTELSNYFHSKQEMDQLTNSKLVTVPDNNKDKMIH